VVPGGQYCRKSQVCCPPREEVVEATEREKRKDKPPYKKKGAKQVYMQSQTSFLFPSLSPAFSSPRPPKLTWMSKETQTVLLRLYFQLRNKQSEAKPKGNIIGRYSCTQQKSLWVADIDGRSEWCDSVDSTYKSELPTVSESAACSSAACR